MTVGVGRRLVLRADPPTGRPATPTVLVGRDPDLAVLRQAMHTAAVDGRCILISGDAGAGKTALLTTFLGEARRAGVAIVGGACVEIESRRPFGAVADLVASTERAFGSRRVERCLAERGVALRLLTVPSATAEAARGDRYQMHGALLGLFTDLSDDGPLCVFVEDLHWADEASLDLFGYLARRLRSRPVLLIATYRGDELDRRHPLRPALAELRRARLADEIAIGPLDPQATGALIEARLCLRGAAPIDLREFRDWIHDRCGGDPLHTEETLDALRLSGRLRYADGAWACDVAALGGAIPASVADGVVGRWARLSPAAQQVLLIASVAGHMVDLELLAHVSGISTEALAPLMHEAIDARLVLDETADRPLSFRHALTREALQQQLLRSERAELHAKIASFLGHRRGRVPVSAAELAYHLDEAGDRMAASGYHVLAAREAAALTDFPSASRSMERAIATAAGGDAEQGRQQLELAAYLRLAGDHLRATRATAAALEIGQRIDDPRLQGEALIALTTEAINSDPAPGRELSERAVALLEPLGPSAELARGYSAVAGTLSRLGDSAAALPFAERAQRTAALLGLGAERAFATMQVGVALAAQGRLAEGVAASREAIAIAEGAGLVDELYAALMTLRVQLVAGGASAGEQRELQLRMRAVARSHGLAKQAWIVRELAFLHQEADWDGFLTLLRQLPDPDRSDVGQPRLMAMFTALARGGPGELGPLDVEQLRIAYRSSAPAAQWAAELLLAAGRAEDAVKFAAEIRDEDTRTTYWGLIPASVVHAVGLFAARECNDAIARERFVASLLLERPLPVTANFNRRHVALATGDIAESAGRLDDALTAYAVALEECERSQYNNSVMYLMSLVRQRRAELYLRATPADIASAQAELDALLPYWQKAEATWILERLREWADERGLAMPTVGGATVVRSGSPQRLTPRELEVARLVAQGLTDREIGARLTVSVRTAESHVERVRLKLGFRTRSQVASWVTERYGASRPH